MKHLLLIVTVIIAAVLASGCGRDNRADSVPRRYAYPRVEPLDTATRASSIGDLTFDISASARPAESDSGWLDIYYPPYRSTLHLTYKRLADDSSLGRAVANRRERTLLDLADRTATQISGRTMLFDFETTVSYEKSVTPVQFLATGPGHRMVWGVFVLEEAPLSADSIRPVVDQLEKETLRIISTLVPRP